MAAPLNQQNHAMSQFEHLIDPTEFRTVARYLKDPKSEISLVFHLRERAMISALAEDIQRESETIGIRPGKFPLCVEKAIENGTLKVSARDTHLRGLDRNSSWYVLAQDIDPKAGTWVLYFPPAYIAYTPGLFEGHVMRKERDDLQTHGKTQNQPGSLSQSQSGPGQTGSTTTTTQSQSQGQGHGQGH